MKIIITEIFEKDFLKILKYKCFMKDFIKLLKTKKHKFIELKYPYKKFKYKIGKLSLRSILFYTFDDKIIPIFISKKSDKKKGNNVILDSYFEDILEKKLRQIKQDLVKGNYSEYIE